MSTQTILVTGAAGFIGMHASLALAKKGCRVIGLDNFNHYYSPFLKRKRADLLQQHDIYVADIDLNDRSSLAALFAAYPFTHVLHLAAQAGVRYAQTHPEAYITSNIHGFLSILELLRLSPHIKLIYASSSSVYGCNRELPFSTTHTTDQPANLYAVTKKTNELMAFAYYHQYGIRSIGLRFFTVYGPWGRPDMAYYTFTQAILARRPIRLFNEGQMQRDFTYIDDIVQGIVAAIAYPGELEIFNLGHHRPVSLHDFVALLERLLDKRAIIHYDPQKTGEVETTCADIRESKRKLGYIPHTDLAEGLTRFIDWYTRYAPSFDSTHPQAM